MLRMKKTSIILLLRMLAGFILLVFAYGNGLDIAGVAVRLEYFIEYMHLSFFSSYAIYLAVSVLCLQLLAGIALLLNMCSRYLLWLIWSLVFILCLFSLIIFFSNRFAYANFFPGIFALSPLQMLGKEMLLLVLLSILIRNLYHGREINASHRYSIFAVFLLAFGGIMFFNSLNLPIVDNSPFRIGAYIPEIIAASNDITTDRHEIFFYYRNRTNGQLKKFTEKNYPWKDTAEWEFVSYENVLVKKGYLAPIHSFTIRSMYGENKTGEILNSPDYNFLFIATDLSAVSENILRKANETASRCLYADIFAFYGLTASAEPYIRRTSKRYHFAFEFLQTDKFLLKSMIAAGTGMLLIKEGRIINKWHYRHLPIASLISSEGTVDVSVLKKKTSSVPANCIFALLFVGGLLYVYVKINVKQIK